MKNKWLLYIALGLPIAMLISVTFLVLYQQKNMQAQYAFVYAQVKRVDAYRCIRSIKAEFIPQNLQLTAAEQMATLPCEPPLLYIYDVATDQSRPISITEAKQLAQTAITNPQAPDGFTVLDYCNLNVQFNWLTTSEYYHHMCINKGHYRRALNIKLPTDRIFTFLFWVKPTSSKP